jgi:hypothetical protein
MVMASRKSNGCSKKANLALKKQRVAFLEQK